jgi:hypothetical protein
MASVEIVFPTIYNDKANIREGNILSVQHRNPQRLFRVAFRITLSPPHGICSYEMPFLE